MKLALAFSIWMLVIGLLSSLWMKILPGSYGLVPFIASMTFGIAVGVFLLGGIDDGIIKTIGDAKRAVVDGGSIFLEWSAYLLGALLLGAVGFFVVAVCPSL